MADDLTDDLRDVAYETDLCWRAAAEIERLRALADQLAEALRVADDLFRTITAYEGDELHEVYPHLLDTQAALAAYEASRKEADRG